MTTHAAVPDVQATAPIQQRLREHGLPPGEHYLDSGYPSADFIHAAAKLGTEMVTPALLDHSRQAKAAEGFDKSAFCIDWKARQASCPAQRASSNWNHVQQHGKDAIVVTFAATTCGSCPLRDRCTTSRQGRRMLTLQPRELHETLAAARAEQQTNAFKARYRLRAGVEGTINQALDVTGIRRARYRSLTKVRLQHAFSAAALNVIRLDAHWSTEDASPALSRTSRLTRLSYRLTA
jgi:Transposase DDE domain